MFVEILGTTLTAATITYLVQVYRHASKKAKENIDSSYELICGRLNSDRDFLISLWLLDRNYKRSNLEEILFDQRVEHFEDIKEFYQDDIIITNPSMIYFSKEQQEKILRKYNAILALINTNQERVKLL
mgnify:CR=1 FL=1